MDWDTVSKARMIELGAFNDKFSKGLFELTEKKGWMSDDQRNRADRILRRYSAERRDGDLALDFAMRKIATSENPGNMRARFHQALAKISPPNEAPAG